MKSIEHYDAIILGGGPAGLCLGSKLSKDHEILIIEKDKIGRTTKAWTSERNIVTKSGFGRFISASFKKSYIKGFNVDKAYVDDDFVSVDESGLLRYLCRKVVENGSVIKEKCEFARIIRKSDCTRDNRIVIKTTKGHFSCRLLIDCTGINSKITKKYKIYERVFYLPVYGGIYNLTLKDEDVCLIDAIIKVFPLKLLEFFPVSKKSIVFYTFQYLKNKKDPFMLRKDHIFNVKNCLIKEKMKGIRPSKEIYGIIPVGMMKKHCVNNIFFFGDTCLIGAPLIGTGFTNILQHYKKYARHISNCLKNDTLSEKELEYRFSETELINRNFQSIIGSLFLHIRQDEYDLIVEILNSLPNRIILRLLFLRLKVPDYNVIVRKIINEIGLKRLARVLPKEEYMFLTIEASKIMEEIAIEEAEKIFHMHNKGI